MTFEPTPFLTEDTHDRELVSHVRPTDYTNPEPKKRYHLVVIGGGTAGLVSAAGAAGLGANVALIERDAMGGDCLNVGCVPSKGVISAARAWHGARNGGVFGAPPVAGEGDFAKAMERMRKLRAGISSHDGVKRFSDLGVDVFQGHGKFIDANTIEVDGKRLKFRKAVIATGARAVALDIPGLEESGYVNNETIFMLTEVPKRFVVIGAGPIGCEMAQSFARFGSEVTVIDRGDHVLPREDPDAAKIVQESMLRDGVTYVPGAKIERVERTETGGKRVVYSTPDGERSVDCDELLMGVGRKPNTDGLGLEAAGVEHDTNGVSVDERMRTTNKRVFACGDVASRYKFTHAADAQARIVIQNALFFGRARADKLVMPWATYTSPEVAHVGMYEQDAKDAGIEVDTITIGMDEVDRAILDGQDEGFLRVHVKRGSDKILGATLVAEHAGDMIGELALAVSAGVGMGKIAQTIHPYPTQGEVVKKAADAWRRTKLTPTVAKIFKSYFKLIA